jgi:hypothetical protein
MGTMVADSAVEDCAPKEVLAVRGGEFICEAGMHSGLLSISTFTGWQDELRHPLRTSGRRSAFEALWPYLPGRNP